MLEQIDIGFILETLPMLANVIDDIMHRERYFEISTDGFVLLSCFAFLEEIDIRVPFRTILDADGRYDSCPVRQRQAWHLLRLVEALDHFRYAHRLI